MSLNRCVLNCVSLIAHVFALACLFAIDAHAQAFPTRTITMITPIPPGPPIEQVLRSISAQMATTLGQPVVVENRVGANSRLGVNAVKAAPGDGYTLTMTIDGTVISQPLADPGFPLEMGRDYVPVAFLCEFPVIVVANGELPATSLKGLIEYSKANPGKLNWAITAGASSHFMAERIRQVAGIDVTMVPYKGAALALTDLLAGRVHLNISDASAAQYIDAGKLKAIATTGTQRWKPYPNVPTMMEGGLPLATTVWFGILTSPGTPSSVVGTLNKAINSALRHPDIAKQLEGFGMSTGSYSTPAEFAAFMQSEIKAWEPVIRKAGIRIN